MYTSEPWSMHDANICLGGGFNFKNCLTNSRPIPWLHPVTRTDVGANVIVSASVKVQNIGHAIRVNSPENDIYITVAFVSLGSNKFTAHFQLNVSKVF